MVTLRERTERHVSPISSGTRGEGAGEVAWVEAEGNDWRLVFVGAHFLDEVPYRTDMPLHYPQETIFTRQPEEPHSSALTQVRQEPRSWVKYSDLVLAAATAALEIPPVSMLGIFSRIDSILKQYLSARSTESHSLYHAPAQPVAGRAEPMVSGVAEEERPVVLIEAPILRQYLVSVAGPTKAEYRPGYRFPGDSR